MLHRAKAGLSACAFVALAGWIDGNPVEPWTEPKLGIELVAIPPGAFDMGSPPGEPMREEQERQHRVRLTNGFSLARHEVTQELWTRVMGSNPSHFKGCPRCPVERVSFQEISAFLTRLNAQAADPRFRLPTEAEWEYACRAGGTAAFGARATIDADAANYNSEYPMPGGGKAAARGRTVAVGSFPPNRWGLFDMHGNVWEWTSDWHCPYPAGSVSDPTGQCASEHRVIRGGSWYFDAASARCALRYTHRPQDSGFSLGFRLAHDRAPASLEQGRALSAPEMLLDKMTGHWVLTGTIAKRQTTHDVDVDWVLNRQYLRIHEVSRDKDASGGIGYEAWIYIVWDAKASDYAVLWLDNTAATNFAAEGIGHAKPDGDRIPFIFKFTDGSGIHTTFAYDRATDVWSWTIDNVDKSGKASEFANVTLTRKK